MILWVRDLDMALRGNSVPHDFDLVFSWQLIWPGRSKVASFIYLVHCRGDSLAERLGWAPLPLYIILNLPTRCLQWSSYISYMVALVQRISLLEVRE